MAIKSGLDFFPLDVCVDKKFELIEAEYGLTGFGVIVHLLQEIYGKEGYYIEWTEEVALLFARSCGLGGSVVSEIIEASIRRGMFDKEIYDKYHVLTSRGIQKRYFEAVSRRKSLEVDYNILLVECAKICPNVNISSRNVNILSKNADIQRHSRVEESRVEKSRVKESIGAEPEPASTPPVCQIMLNDKSLYPVFQADVDKWAELYPAVDILAELRKMAGWCDANPSKRKTKGGVQRFINGWLAKEQDRGGAGSAPPVRRYGKPDIPKGASGELGDAEMEAIRQVLAAGADERRDAL